MKNPLGTGIVPLSELIAYHLPIGQPPLVRVESSNFEPHIVTAALEMSSSLFLFSIGIWPLETSS